jgi:hypothetical protein
LTRAATFLTLYQSKAFGEPQRILDCRPTCSSERGYRVYWQNAYPGFLAGAGYDGQSGCFPLREGGGDRGRDSAARGLSPATLKARLSIRRPRRGLTAGGGGRGLRHWHANGRTGEGRSASL